MNFDLIGKFLLPQICDALQPAYLLLELCHQVELYFSLGPYSSLSEDLSTLQPETWMAVCSFADLSRWPHCFMWLERSHGMQSLVFCQAHTMVKLFTSNLKLPLKTLVRVPFLYTLLYNLSHELLHHTLSHLNLHLHCMERNELSNRGKHLRKMMEAATGDNHICNSKNIPTVRVTIDRSKKCLTAGQADPKLENQSRSYINCVVEQCRIISTVILYESSPK